MALSFMHQKKSSANPEETADKMITKAQRKSEELLEGAVKEAELIIAQTKTFRDELQKKLTDDIAYQAAQFAQAYQGLLPEVRKAYDEGVKTQLAGFESQLRSALVEIEKSLQDKITSLSVLLKDQILQEFAMVQKELAEYKKTKMSEVDQAAQNITKRAVFDLVGKTISLTDHHQLIRQALEKAKKEGVFENK